MENWKDIKGFEGKYQISDFGRIKSLARVIGNGKGYFVAERILPNQLDADGYWQNTLATVNRQRKNFRISKLVLTHFAPDRFIPGLPICHRDGNVNNNHVSNLYSGTVIENTIDRYRHGNTKLSLEQIGEIKQLIGTMPQDKIAALYGVRQNYISRLKNGTRGKAFEAVYKTKLSY